MLPESVGFAVGERGEGVVVGLQVLAHFSAHEMRIIVPAVVRLAVGDILQRAELLVRLSRKVAASSPGSSTSVKTR